MHPCRAASAKTLRLTSPWQGRQPPMLFTSFLRSSQARAATWVSYFFLAAFFAAFFTTFFAAFFAAFAMDVTSFRSFLSCRPHRVRDSIKSFYHVLYHAREPMQAHLTFFRHFSCKKMKIFSHAHAAVSPRIEGHIGADHEKCRNFPGNSRIFTCAKREKKTTQDQRDERKTTVFFRDFFVLRGETTRFLYEEP